MILVPCGLAITARFRMFSTPNRPENKGSRLASYMHLRWGMRIKLWGSACAALALGIAAIACGDADPPPKQPLVVCTAGESGCPAEKPANQKKQNPGTTTTSGGPTEPPEQTKEPPPANTTNDAGAVADSGPVGPPPTGPICTKLKDCCKQLEEAGYSPATCIEIVDTRSENACSLQHKQYKDFGDCS
jgi:hypothetical protein